MRIQWHGDALRVDVDRLCGCIDDHGDLFSGFAAEHLVDAQHARSDDAAQRAVATSSRGDQRGLANRGIDGGQFELDIAAGGHGLVAINIPLVTAEITVEVTVDATAVVTVVVGPARVFDHVGTLPPRAARWASHGYRAPVWHTGFMLMNVPEGDTIHRAAAALRTALVGKPIKRFDAPRLNGPHPAPGRIVERVESHGKHLEITWDDGLILHTHMRMSGSWHLYRDGERWQKSAKQMRVEIDVGDWVAVCFNAPVVETYRQFDRSRHPGLGSLGPDLCKESADLDECINRLYHHPDQSLAVAEVLLDQHIVCGVGNVYRCEVLWACEVHPFAPVSSLDAADCAQLVHTAARMLRANLQHAGRITTTSTKGGLAVYGRNGQGCSRCGDTIEVCRSGEHARLLYWCPGCQLHHSPALHTGPDADDSREMDPHPAAAKFLSDLPWRRHAG